MSPLKIIDSHFHVWDLQQQTLDWLNASDDVATLRRSFSIEELVDEYRKVPDVALEGLIHVEADTTDSSVEDHKILTLMEQVPALIGAVTHKRLTETISVASDFVGVREVLHNSDIPRGRCLQDSFLQGLEALASQNTVFEAVIREEELSDLYQACAAVPKAVVALNHCGNVSRLDHQYIQAIESLAALPNVYCKISGLPADQPQFSQKVLGLLESTFSRERLLYASNWPVVKLNSSVQENLELLRSFFGDDADVFSRNAQHVYKLKG